MPRKAPIIPAAPIGKAGPQAVPGFSRVIWKEWPDDKIKLPPIDTVNEGGWGPGCVLVIAFTPTRGGSASITPFPNDGSQTKQKVALGTTPGDFSLPFPYVRKGENVGIQWQVGGSSRTNCVLTAGQRYYLSYTWEGQNMRVQV